MDIQPEPIDFLEVNGDIIIKEDLATLEVSANNIWIRAGSITAGSDKIPHTG